VRKVEERNGGYIARLMKMDPTLAQNLYPAVCPPRTHYLWILELKPPSRFEEIAQQLLSNRRAETRRRAATRLA
jgi:hypothetical protein